MGRTFDRDARRSYQQRVQALLDAIEERRRREHTLAAWGVTLDGMRGLEDDLRGLRAELATVVAAGL